MSLRGGPLELAILRASRSYRKEGRLLCLLKQEPRFSSVGIVGAAPVDFIGCLGGNSLVIEAKTTQQKSLPFSDLRDDQRQLMTLFASVDADVRLIVYFSTVDEAYSVQWNHETPNPTTRQSWPLAWFRAHGLLLPQEGTHTNWRVLFLDGALHPQRAEAIAQLAREKPRATPAEVETPEPAPRAKPDERSVRDRILAAAAEGTRRAAERQKWRKSNPWAKR
jgi:hypothetical protein